MKIDPFTRRTVTNPTSGITWTKAEKDQITELAIGLADLPQSAVAVIRRSLAYEALRLEDAYEWTTPGSDAEEQRQAQYRDALLTYEATFAANAARNASARIAKAGA